jgi:hypothetical protein
MMWPILLLGLMCLSWSSVAAAGTPRYAVVEGGRPPVAAYGDPADAHPARWQVWLYPTETPANGTPGFWGILEGRTATEVLQQLARYQSWQRQKPAGTSAPDAATFLNAYGPIAVMAALPAGEPQRLGEIATGVEQRASEWVALDEENPRQPGSDEGRSVRRKETVGAACRAVARARAGLERQEGLAQVRQELDRALSGLIELTQREGPPPTTAATAAYEFAARGDTPGYRMEYRTVEEGDSRWKIEARMMDQTGKEFRGEMTAAFDLRSLRRLATEAVASAPDPAALWTNLVLDFAEGTARYRMQQVGQEPQEGTTGLLRVLYPTREAAEGAQRFWEGARAGRTDAGKPLEDMRRALRGMGESPWPFLGIVPGGPTVGGGRAESIRSVAPPPPTAGSANRAGPDGEDFDALFERLRSIDKTLQ